MGIRSGVGCVCARMCVCVCGVWENWLWASAFAGTNILFPYNKKEIAKGKARPHRGLNPGPVAHIGDYYDVYQGVFNPCFYS